LNVLLLLLLLLLQLLSVLLTDPAFWHCTLL